MDNELIKYPRTPHLPQSAGVTSDDRIVTQSALKHLSSLPEFVVTEKMDGGNVTLTRNYFFARSLDSGTHLWDTQAKALWASVRFNIPEGWRISGESVYARRSVGYDNLAGPFLIFGIWNEENVMLSWDEIEEWAALLELPVVPTLYRGNDFESATKIWGATHDSETSEGFVVRNAGRFHYNDFATNVAKYVRANHVRTSASWRSRDDFDVNGFSN